MNKSKKKKANRHKKYTADENGKLTGKSKYAKKKQEQARGKFRPTSPFKLV